MVSFATVFLPAMFLIYIHRYTYWYIYTHSWYISAAVYRLKKIPKHAEVLIPKQSNKNSELRLLFMG